MGLADIFGIYFPPSESVYLVPVAEVSGFSVQLRLKPALNKQRRRVRMAAEYSAARWTVDSLRNVSRTAPPNRGEYAPQVA